MKTNILYSKWKRDLFPSIFRGKTRKILEAFNCNSYYANLKYCAVNHNIRGPYLIVKNKHCVIQTVQYYNSTFLTFDYKIILSVYVRALATEHFTWHMMKLLQVLKYDTIRDRYVHWIRDILYAKALSVKLQIW